MRPATAPGSAGLHPPWCLTSWARARSWTPKNLDAEGGHEDEGVFLHPTCVWTSGCTRGTGGTRPYVTSSRAGLLQPRHPAIPCSEDDPFLSLSGDSDTGGRPAVLLTCSLCSARSRWGEGLFPASRRKGPTSSLSHDHTPLQRSWKSVPSQVGMAPQKCNSISELGRESERGLWRALVICHSPKRRQQVGAVLPQRF